MLWVPAGQVPCPYSPLQFISGCPLGDEGDNLQKLRIPKAGSPFPCNWIIGKNKSDSLLDLCLLF